MKKILFAQLIIIVFSIFMPITVLAQNYDYLRAELSLPDELKPDYVPDITLETRGADGKRIPGSEADYVNYFLQLLAGGFLYLAGPAAILVIAISGLRYVTAHGDQNQMEGAKKNLEFAIIGLVVIILSFAIVKGIIQLLVSL